MTDLAHELKLTVEAAAGRLLTLSEAESQTARAAGQWSPKQVLGHLIDSAANNHPRFVQAQFTSDLVFIGYAQEQWVNVQHYEAERWSALVELWQAYNRHLAHVIAHIPADTLTRSRHPHTLDKISWQPVSADQPATLEYLIRDYVGHLQMHLGQIFSD